MIDVFNVSDNSAINQVFYTKGNTDWQTWNKPQNAKFISIFCLGSGGGGGAGQAGSGSTTRRGGGGGGSAGLSIGMFSASQIPDTLFLQVAAGGLGGVAANGGSGAISYISVQSNTTAINILLQSSLAAAGGGFSGANAGTAGIAATAWTGNILNDLGLATSNAGQAGATGSTGTTGASIAITLPISGGASGAGATTAVFSGGNITGAGFVDTITGGTGNINLNGTDGSGGYTSFMPGLSSGVRQATFFTGGAGGGSSNNFTGGAGGCGSHGSGGGGGGAGVTGQGGNGGRGGDGLIIIAAW